MSFTLSLDVDTAKVAGGQNPTRQLGSHCLSHGPKRTLLEAEQSLQPHPPTQIPLQPTAKHRVTQFHSQLSC